VLGRIEKAAHFLRPSQTSSLRVVLAEVVLYQSFNCLFLTFFKKLKKGLDRWGVNCIFHGPLARRAAL